MKFICSDCNKLMDSPYETIVFSNGYTWILCKDCYDYRYTPKDLNTPEVSE